MITTLFARGVDWAAELESPQSMMVVRKGQNSTGPYALRYSSAHWLPGSGIPAQAKGWDGKCWAAALKARNQHLRAGAHGQAPSDI